MNDDYLVIGHYSASLTSRHALRASAEAVCISVSEISRLAFAQYAIWFMLLPTKKPVALAVKPVVDVIKIERNPFVAPTDSITLPSSGSKDPITQGVSRPIANNVAPVLKGIVGNGTTSLAIIESNGTSNYYRIGQRVGNYTVSYIGGNIVDLFGAENSIRLFMGGK